MGVGDVLLSFLRLQEDGLFHPLSHQGRTWHPYGPLLQRHLAPPAYPHHPPSTPVSVLIMPPETQGVQRPQTSPASSSGPMVPSFSDLGSIHFCKGTSLPLQGPTEMSALVSSSPLSTGCQSREQRRASNAWGATRGMGKVGAGDAQGERATGENDACSTSASRVAGAGPGPTAFRSVLLRL